LLAVLQENLMTPRFFQRWGRRISRIGLWGILALGAGWTGGANAGSEVPLVNAERAYTRGDYEQAASLARGQTSPEAAVLTARALLTKAMLLPENDPEVLSLATTALSFADAARAERPTLVEAHLDAAIARGLQAEFLSYKAAVVRVEEARSAIDRALELAPNDPWVQATNGGWHLTLTAKLGPLAANILFNARRDVGLDAFNRAFELEPSNPKLLYHFAKVRMLQGDGLALPEARAALRKLQILAPRDALGRTLLSMTSALLSAIDAEELARANEIPGHL
jgi:tetratricopeptide (TPR) repeat protein